MDAEQSEQELPLVVARIQGQALTEMPSDLYIPPEALEVFLETFHGPLDLLLYLIKKQNLDILDIPVAEITRQYMEYVELMKTLHLELAAEYLVMAALLTEIKSRLLLPKPAAAEIEEADPRAELVRRLQAYEQIKNAAEQLAQLPQVGRDIFLASVQAPAQDMPRPQPEVEMKALLKAFLEVMQRAALYARHAVRQERLSVRERMSEVLDRLKDIEEYTEFHQLFSVQEGKSGVVVTFIAILELLRQSLIEIVQQSAFSPIHVRASR